ncbi:MAG: bacteriohemerythrin [Wenzhouxiangella sp.]|nr:bacteriohemerythrin [Wenzhouxiangella sp.]
MNHHTRLLQMAHRQDTDPNTLALLCRQASESSEPIAVLDQAGEVAYINALMRQALPGGALSSKAKSQLTGTEGQRFYSLENNDGAQGAGRQLFAISLAGYRIVTLIERADDPRVGRLRAQLEEAYQRSITDPLTGVWNRNQFNEFIRVEIPRSERYEQPACLLILDIDHFKQVNDSHGHGIGDQVLQRFAGLVQGQIRVVDSLFRWGGEEFVVLLPNTSLTAARFIADRIRRAVGEADFEPVPQVTVSIGAAELERGESPDDWFDRADKAIYLAKAQGRNQVVCAPADPARLIGSSDDEQPVLLPWKSSYESGHPLIDAQHKELFRLGNQLITASLSQDTRREEFLQLADDLIEHVALHFSDEEAILAEIGYDDLEQHHRAHNGLLSRARKLRDQAERGTATTRDVIHFLANNVVKQHMLKADMAFFSQLTEGHAASR